MELFSFCSLRPSVPLFLCSFPSSSFLLSASIPMLGIEFRDCTWQPNALPRAVSTAFFLLYILRHSSLCCPDRPGTFDPTASASWVIGVTCPGSVSLQCGHILRSKCSLCKRRLSKPIWSHGFSTLRMQPGMVANSSNTIIWEIKTGALPCIPGPPGLRVSTRPA